MPRGLYRLHVTLIIYYRFNCESVICSLASSPFSLTTQHLCPRDNHHSTAIYQLRRKTVWFDLLLLMCYDNIAANWNANMMVRTICACGSVKCERECGHFSVSCAVPLPSREYSVWCVVQLGIWWKAERACLAKYLNFIVSSLNYCNHLQYICKMCKCN